MDKIKQGFQELNKLSILWFFLIVTLLELFSVGIAGMVTEHQNNQTFWGSIFYGNEKIYGRIFAFTTAFILVAIFAKITKDVNEQ